VEIFLGGGVLKSLDIVSPVEDGTKPLGGFILADGLRVRAKVDVTEFINF